MGYVEGCTLEYQICWERALQQTAVKPVVESAKLVCQSNDDFCIPGCEHADMQCIDEENDDNKNGVKDSEENDSQGSSNSNGGSNRQEKTYCDVPNPSNPCHDRRDVDEITGLATCMDGSHEEDWRDCNGGKEYPNCNDVEYGTRCDGSEDENSWTDEEASEESGN